MACAATLHGQPAAASPDRQADIASFEHVWKTVLEKHWDPKLGGLDWQAVHDELRPRIEASKDRAEARRVMSSMLERLHLTHYGIVPREVYDELDSAGERDADRGLDVRFLDGQAVVTSVEPESAAAARGVKAGWAIVRVNGTEIAPVLESIRKQYSASTLLDLRLQRAVLSRLQGKKEESARVDFLDGSNRPVSIDLPRAAPRGRVVNLGNFPPMRFWSEWRKARPDVGYIRFNAFFEPESLSKTVEEAVNGCRDCRGFVIDLRGNPGGIGGLSMGIAGWFVDRPGLQLGTMFLRGTTIKFVIFPRPQPFRGPMAVLVDGCSASTSEIFAGGLKDVGRARIFGTRTAGAALPSVFERLPNGDGFQYAIANYISEGGKPLEGLGVTPDQEVRLTRRALLEGKDPVLEASLQWIETEKK